MAKPKRPPLTKKRQTWAEERGGHTFKGGVLHYPAAPAARYESDLDRMIREMTDAYARELTAVFNQNELLVMETAPTETSSEAAVSAAMDASLPSQARITLNRLYRRFSKMFRQRAPTIVDRIFGQVDKASASSLHSSLKELSGGLSLKTKTMPASLGQAMSAATAENVALIKSIPDQYRTQIEGAVMRSMQPGGNGLQDVREALNKYKDMTQDRAKTIAHDQVKKATAALNAERAQNVGIKKFEWIHSGGGAHPRKDHVAMSGNIYSYDDLPVIDQRTGERGLPGQAINCHPGDSRIEITSGCVKLYRRRYAGELLSLVSNDGVVLKATPNHPVLTLKGWKAAKDIDLGDYLVKSSHHGIYGRHVDVQSPVAEFAQAFDSASLLIGTDSVHESGDTALEFHGDISDCEVDVVYVGRFLPNELNASELEEMRELIFAFADSAFDPARERSLSPPDEFVVVPLLAPDRSVSGLCSLLSELRGEPGRAHKASLGLTAYLDSAISQYSADRGSGCSVFVRKLKLAHAEGVLSYDLFARQILAIVSLGFSSRDAQSPSADGLGQIVGVDAKLVGDGGKSADTIKHGVCAVDKIVSEDFSGHVYNLETVNNWYVSSGIVTHNCRCVARPIVDFGEE